MAIKKDENKLAAGITIFALGIIHLLTRMRIAPVQSAFWQELIDWRSIILIAALSFLIVKTDKTLGIILLVLGILLRMGLILHYMGNWEAYLMPLSLIVFGSILIIGVLRK
ncbi:hypothetical protein [Parabacteroides sp. FAFU027]|uniref:hypothetical protein n=1 Tax=Parabacteroides sp. FAFU027 TaxID=2922715 RepID=UPI001FAF47FA|nr:hypothetical protein [Parabacteroides sp. FAFU027]